VIKVATRSDLARRWHDLMDVNAGHRRRRSQHRGRGLGAVPPDAGRGQRPQAKTWAEHWKLHNALVLFNPAPVT
jgi:galactarate dehydratase